MKSKNAFILVMTLAVVCLGGILFSVYKVFDKNKEYFYTNGYVIDTASENNEKIYFTKDTNYKRKYNGDVVFSDITSLKSEISKYSFVYYQDKSIGFLNNSVLMNLDSVGSEFIPYYNIEKNYIISYEDKYYINTATGTINFNNFVAKIADNKYLFAGNDVYLKTSENGEDIRYYFFEVTYEDGNVIKINSDNLNIETISSGSYIYIGSDIKISLEEGLIYYKQTPKIYLSEINITSDSNIDIDYKDLDEETTDDTQDNKTITPNIIENIEYLTETVIDYKNVPYLEILETFVNSNSIGLKFNVLDPDNLINSDVSISYQNLKTKELVTEKISNIKETINYVKDYLQSDTSYLVTISTTYTKNNANYSAVLLSRVLTTSDIGIDLEKDYVSSSEIGYHINKSSDSLVTAFTLNLYDNDNTLIRSQEFNETNGDLTYTFENLDSNKYYNAKIENVYVGGVLVENLNNGISQNKTLKVTPLDNLLTVSPIATTNKQDYNFTFDISMISDPENSVTGVTYNIYKKSNNSLVKTIKKENLNQITVDVDDDLVSHEIYYYKAVLSINDGEKIVEYETEKSNNFGLDSKKYPTVNFNKESVTANTLNGKFVITDEDLTIDVTKPIYVIYTDSLGNEKTKSLTTTNSNTDKEKKINLELTELASSDIYTIRLMAYVDIKDDEAPADTIQIGAIKINTAYADTILVKLSTITLPDNRLAQDVFNLKVNFSIDELITPASIKENFRKFTVKLYEGYNGSGNYVGSYTLDDYTEVQEYFTEYGGILKLANFGKSLTDLQRSHLAQGGIISQKYSLVFSEGYTSDDLVEFKPISANLLNFDINDKLITLLNDDADISVSLIENSGTYTDLDNTTAIGFHITTEFTSNREFAKEINFKINDLTSGEEKTFTKEVSLTSGSANPVFDIMFSEDENFYKRGHSYKISYTVLLDLDSDGIYDYEYPFNEGDITTPKPVVSEQIDVYKQTPSFVIFPWSSDSNSVIFKYKVTDIDNTLASDYNFYYTTGLNSDLQTTKAECSKLNNITSIYSCMKVSNLTKDNDYNIYLKAKLLDNTDFDVAVNSYTFEGTYEGTNALAGLNVEALTDDSHISNYTNLFVLQLSEDYDNLTDEEKSSARALKNRISYYTIELVYADGSTSNKFVINNINDVKLNTAPYSANIIDYYKNGSKTKSWNNTLSTDSALAKTAYVDMCEDETHTCIYIDYAKLYNSEIFGPYFKNSINKDVTINVKAMYDSGKIAYDISASSQKYTFQVLKSANYTNNNNRFYNNAYLYSYDNSKNNIQFHNGTLGATYYYFNDYSNSRYGFIDDDNDNKISFVNIAFNNLSAYDNKKPYKYVYSTDYKVQKSGITVNLKSADMPIVAKALEQTTIASNLNNKYDKVVPGIKVNSSVSSLNGIKLKLGLSGLDESILYKQDNTYYVYLEVYDNDTIEKSVKVPYDNLTSQSGTISNNKFTLKSASGYYYDLTKVTVDGEEVTNYYYDYKTGIVSNVDGSDITVDYRIVINDLVSDKTHTLKAYMLKSAQEKIYLIDLDTTLYETFAYDFTVNKLSNITVSNASFEVVPESYSTRYITTSYIISDVMDIDNLTYSICKNNVCVKANPKSCDESYNTLNYSCISKSGNNYIIKYTTEAENENNSNFIYGTNYTLKIIAKSHLNDSYEIYSGDSNVRQLENPTFNVSRTSEYNANTQSSDATFNVEVSDPDFVITSSGKYNAKLYKVDGASQEEIFKSNTNYNAANNEVINYTTLALNSEYDLIINYNTFRNNESTGEDEEIFSIHYPIYTVNSYDVSAGVIDYDFNTDPDNFILKFFYSSNIAMHIYKDQDNVEYLDSNQNYVGGINYQIRRKEGSTYVSTGRVIFSKTSKNYQTGSSITIKNVKNQNGNLVLQTDYTLGNITTLSEENSFYQVKLPHDTLENALYTLDITFYITGEVTNSITTESACYSDSISNLWIRYSNNTGECLKYNNITYTTDKLYGGD